MIKTHDNFNYYYRAFEPTNINFILKNIIFKGIDNPIGMPADKDSAKAADYPSVKIDNVFILNTYSSHGEPNSDDRALIYGYFKKLDIINSTFENNYRYRIDYSLKGTVLGIFGMKEDASITNSTFQNNILDAGDFDIAHNAGGAAIYYRATGNLKIKNSHFIKNRIYGVDLSNMNTGGAINFKGTGAALEIEGSDFDGNVASPAGAIFYSGPLLKITDSVFSRNIALSAGYDDREEGAAIYTQAKNTIINNSVFSANSGSLGIIYNESGDLTIGNSLFQNNISPLSKQGNAIYSKKGQITITSSTFKNNFSSKLASGAIYSKNGNVLISDSSFVNNSIQIDSGDLTLQDMQDTDFQNSTVNYLLNDKQGSIKIIAKNIDILSLMKINHGAGTNLQAEAKAGRTIRIDGGLGVRDMLLNHEADSTGEIFADRIPYDSHIKIEHGSLVFGIDVDLCAGIPIEPLANMKINAAKDILLSLKYIYVTYERETFKEVPVKFSDSLDIKIGEIKAESDNYFYTAVYDQKKQTITFTRGAHK